MISMSPDGSSATPIAEYGLLGDSRTATLVFARRLIRVADDPDRARAVGFFVHFANGQAFALGYAAAFAVLGLSSLWLGAALGLLHALVALLVIVPLLPGIHPRLASDRAGPAVGPTLEPPGLLALNYGAATRAVAIVAPVLFGAALGLLIGP
jgi:hypothetical protein